MHQWHELAGRFVQLTIIIMRHASGIMQVAMVTGGAQGLGLSFAEALGEAGASVAIVDINGSKAEAASAHLQKKGIRSIALQADVTNPDDCTR